MGSGFHVETGCRKVYTGTVLKRQKKSILLHIYRREYIGTHAQAHVCDQCTGGMVRTRHRSLIRRGEGSFSRDKGLEHTHVQTHNNSFKTTACRVTTFLHSEDVEPFCKRSRCDLKRHECWGQFRDLNSVRSTAARILILTNFRHLTRFNSCLHNCISTRVNSSSGSVFDASPSLSLIASQRHSAESTGQRRCVESTRLRHDALDTKHWWTAFHQTAGQNLWRDYFRRMIQNPQNKIKNDSTLRTHSKEFYANRASTKAIWLFFVK